MAKERPPEQQYYTRKEWCQAYLKGLGNTRPSPYVLNWVIAWTQAETTAPHPLDANYAYFNLLNTTQPGHGGYIGTNIQGPARRAGVKDYPSFKDGIAANVQVTKNGLYNHLFLALVGNDHTALAGPTSEINRELGIWGTGQGAAIASLAANPARLVPGDRFPGKASGVPAGDPGSSFGSTGTGGLTDVVTNAVQSVHISPDESVVQFLQDMDTALALTNPFDVKQEPTFNIATPLGTAKIPDPVVYLEDIAGNIINNGAAFFVRLLFLFIGVVIVVAIVQASIVAKATETVGGASGIAQIAGAL